MLHIEIIFTFILQPITIISSTPPLYSLHLFTLCFLTSSPPQLGAHYSKPPAKHFPGPRRRRRMALVSPCPLGDVQHPTYPKIDAQDNEKCQMWQSRSLLCSQCEGMSLITFLPPSTPNPPKGAAPPKSIQGSEGHLVWMDTKWEDKSDNLFFSC